jgi:hypothetical protein
MSNPSYMPWIRREDYEAFRRLTPKDDLPNTFDEWFDRAMKLIRDHEAHRRRVNKVEVEPQQFSAWCRASGVNPNDTTLGAFAVKLANDGKN